jgi:uncharacterized protein YacL
LTDTSNIGGTAAPPAVVQTAPAASSKLPSYIGTLMLVLGFALLAAILFLPKAQGTTDAVIQQIISIVQFLIAAYLGWQYGSSQSSQRKDDTIASITK